MSNTPIFKTRDQFAAYIGLSYSSFWRKLKEHQVELPKGLLSPAKQHEIMVLLGVSPALRPEKDRTQENADQMKGFERS